MLFLSLLLACADPAKDKPAAQIVEAPPAAPKVEARAPAPIPGEVLAANGTIGFTAAKITKSHDGSFKTWQGTLEVDGGQLKSVQIEVSIDSVDTGIEKLNSHLRSQDFFDSEKFTKATFKSTSISPLGTPDPGLDGSNATVEGDLEMHGVQKHLRFPAKVEVGPTVVSASTTFSINRQDFKITYPGKPDDLIRDEVVLKIDLNGARAPAVGPAPSR